MAYTSLPALPFELWGYITSPLSNTDIKSLRLTCSQFNNAVFLRFNRVFLSANPLNIEVFRNIASHNEFRYLVTEIIWDEARLPRGLQRISETDNGYELLSDEDEPDNSRECPKWFEEAYKEDFYILRERKGYNMGRADRITRREHLKALPPLRECWQHYQHLLCQQKDVLADKSDLEAFLYGVKQFPALKRVTITPAAHGYLFDPLYPTPMIRAFPKGFNYPIPRGWLYPRLTGVAGTAYEWKQRPESRKQYRGLRTAMRVLANEPNSVSELVMSSNSLPTGINCRIFGEPCEEYDHFATVLKNPGFRHLDIALHVGEEAQDLGASWRSFLNGRPRRVLGEAKEMDEDLEASWQSLLNGRLRRALGEAKEMEEFRLHTTFMNELYAVELPLIPLRSIVPVEKWSNLRHFGLSGFHISRADCISFLNTLPKSVRSIELSMLHFHDHGNWYSMLKHIRRIVSENTLWGDRDATSRPTITIGLPMTNSFFIHGQ